MSTSLLPCILDFWSINKCHSDAKNASHWWMHAGRNFFRYATTKWGATTNVIKSIYLNQQSSCKNKVHLCASAVVHQYFTLRSCRTHTKTICTNVQALDKTYDSFWYSFSNSTSYGYCKSVSCLSKYQWPYSRVRIELHPPQWQNEKDSKMNFSGNGLNDRRKHKLDFGCLYKWIG